MNPFEQKPMNLTDGIMDWCTVYPKPYCKNTVDPYTKVRIILMNGIEVEAIIFSISSAATATTTTSAESLRLQGALNSSSKSTLTG